MLSDRLKGKTLFKVTIEEADDLEKEAIHTALDMLEECVDHLILGMATVENIGLLSREDIEDYVISYMEAYEKRYYSLDEDAFDTFVRNYLKR